MEVPTLNISLGKHFLLECHECDVETLNSPQALKRVFLDAANRSGATVISASFRRFDPQGVSGVVIIAESHFTVHTWPEYRYAAVDMFTCGAKIDFNCAMEVFQEGLGCTDMVVSGEFDRGLVTRNNQMERTIPMEITRSKAVQSWQAKFEQEQAWGLLTSIDIHGCDPDVIRDAEAIRRLVVELTDHIGMRRFGETTVVHFGEDERVAGFSFTQLIETSLISGHLANATNNAYIDIFSCKFYEPQNAANFCVRFFKGRNYTMNVTIRK